MTTAPQPQPADQQTPDPTRWVELTKIGPGRYKATNRRGGVLPIGSGADPDFAPVELMLASLAGCGAIDVDLITGKRASAESFDVRVDGLKVRDEHGHRIVDLRVSFDVTFPDGEDGDRARAAMPRALAQTRDRLCTVGRTIAVGTPVDYVEVSRD